MQQRRWEGAVLLEGHESAVAGQVRQEGGWSLRTALQGDVRNLPGAASFVPELKLEPRTGLQQC